MIAKLIRKSVLFAGFALAGCALKTITERNNGSAVMRALVFFYLILDMTRTGNACHAIILLKEISIMRC